jgi:hypothetical protein
MKRIVIVQMLIVFGIHKITIVVVQMWVVQVKCTISLAHKYLSNGTSFPTSYFVFLFVSYLFNRLTNELTPEIGPINIHVVQQIPKVIVRLSYNICVKI